MATQQVMTMLDAPQTLRSSFDDATQSLKVRSIGDGLVTTPYDDIVLTYIAIGNGTGQIGTVTYKLAGATAATLILTYDSSDRLIEVAKS